MGKQRVTRDGEVYLGGRFVGRVYREGRVWQHSSPGSGGYRTRHDAIDALLQARRKADEPMEATERVLAGKRQPRVHTFDSTKEAYDETQTSDEIADGDVLVVPSEHVVAVLYQAWPSAITEAHGDLHAYKGGADLLAETEGGKYAASVARARNVRDDMMREASDAWSQRTPAYDSDSRSPFEVFDADLISEAEFWALIGRDAEDQAEVPATETVPTGQLRVGDVVVNYGMRIRIDGINPYEGQYGPAWSCPGTVLNVAEVLAAEIVPASFMTREGRRDYWAVQGTNRARWTAELPRPEAEDQADDPEPQPEPGKTLGEMTPAERAALIKRAAGGLQAELRNNAGAIGKIMDEAEAEPYTINGASACGAPVDCGRCGRHPHHDGHPHIKEPGTEAPLFTTITRAQLNTRRGWMWMYSYTSPERQEHVRGDGAPYVIEQGQSVAYGTGLTDLRSMLLRRWGRQLQITEAWRS